jgi:hypothetical protein
VLFLYIYISLVFCDYKIDLKLLLLLRQKMSEKCPICLNIIGEKEGEVEGGERGKIDCCDHYFCSKCIKDCADKSCTMCPICRRQFHTIQSDSVGTINVPDKLQKNSEVIMVGGWTRIGPGEWTLSDVGDMEGEVRIVGDLVTWYRVWVAGVNYHEEIIYWPRGSHTAAQVIVRDRVLPFRYKPIYKLIYSGIRPQKHKYKGYTHYFRKRNKYKDMSHYQRLN